MQAIAVGVVLRCSICGGRREAAILSPLADRSLRNLILLMQGAPENIDTPECCEQHMQIEEMFYAFDEPGLNLLIWGAEEGCLFVAGEEVESEDQLKEIIGRPFSVADLHRLHLSSPGCYSPSPGIVTFAATGDDLENQLAQAYALLEEQRMGEEGVLGPISWGRLSGWRTWLGEPGDRLFSGQLAIISLISKAVVVEALHYASERRELEFIASEEGPRVAVGEFEAPVSLAFLAALTIEEPLTVDEAASWAVSSLRRNLDCCQEVLEGLRGQGFSVIAEPGGMARFQGEEGFSSQLNLASLCRKSGFDPQQVLSQISDLRENARGVAYQDTSGRRSCGCTPLLTLVLRDQDWLDQATSSEEPDIDILSRPAWDGVYSVPVDDCPHSLAYVSRRQLEQRGASEEELFTEARANLGRTSFAVEGKPLHAADGSTHAVAWAGYNISTALLGDNLLRGLDRQSPRVREGPLSLHALCTSQDLVILMDSEADQELLAIQVAGVRKALSDSPWNLDPMVHLEVFRREGDAAGNFTADVLDV